MLENENDAASEGKLKHLRPQKMQKSVCIFRKYFELLYSMCHFFAFLGELKISTILKSQLLMFDFRS